MNKLLALLSTKSTDLFGEIAYYMMVIVEVVTSRAGLEYNTNGRTIRTSHGIACAAGNVQPVLKVSTFSSACMNLANLKCISSP